MALITCSNCGKMVSDKAKACPHCGSPMLTNVDQLKHEESNDAIRSNYNKNLKRKSNTSLIVAAVLGLLALLGACGWLWYNNHQKRAEQERKLAILAEKVRQDSIAAAELREQVRRDSIAEAQKQEQFNIIYNEYSKVLKKHHDGRYFLFDITKDGIPELWVHAYNSHELKTGIDAPVHIFTIKDQRAIELEVDEYGSMHASFGDFYQGSDYIIRLSILDGYECTQLLVNITYNGSRIIERTIRECDCEENIHISEPNISELDLMDYESLKHQLDLTLRI